MRKLRLARHESHVPWREPHFAVAADGADPTTVPLSMPCERKRSSSQGADLPAKPPNPASWMVARSSR
jgi:hypothetical protein